MSASLFTIVTHTAPGRGHLVPRWTGGDTVAAETADGAVDEFPVRRLSTGSLGAALTTDLTLDGISGRVLLTNSRVVVVCRRFHAKGGGWTGFGLVGGVVALVANGVSKARVAARGAGKAAVGHIRHEWVALVGWRSKAWGGEVDEVRIGYHHPAHPSTTTVVDLHVPDDLDPALVAVEIVRRVARHRLHAGHAHHPEVRQRCAELANGHVWAPRPGAFAVVELPAPDPTPAPSAPVPEPRRPQTPTPEYR